MIEFIRIAGGDWPEGPSPARRTCGLPENDIVTFIVPKCYSGLPKNDTFRYFHVFSTKNRRFFIVFSCSCRIMLTITVGTGYTVF